MELSKIKGLCYATASLPLLLFVYNRYMKQKKQKKHCVDWEDIPSEIWMEIGKRLERNLDMVRFRMVSKKLHSCLPSPTLFPLFVPSPPGQIDTNSSYFITEHNVYLDLTKKGIVTTVVDHLGKTRADKYVENHPHILSQPYIRHLSSYHVLLTHTGSEIELCSDVPMVQDLVLISPDIEDGVHPSFARQSHLTAVILYRDSGSLAMMRLGAGTLNWDTDFSNMVFEHIVAYKGKVCLLGRLGNVHLMDYRSCQMTQICEGWDPRIIAPDIKYLRLYVSNCGCIYLIQGCVDERDYPAGGGGYRVDFLLKKWVYDERIR